MVHRGRSLRSDLEMSSAQTGGRSSAHFSSTVAGHPARHFRQFSTRSRTKSAASFKGLHRTLMHDVATDSDAHSIIGNSFTKSKSSDSLYRKRAISGLNMTALTRVKSNPGHIPRSRSGSMVSTHSLGGSRSAGLKPSRSKSTHLVLDLHEGDELYDNDTTTDEEVEYFTDEEDGLSNKADKSMMGDLNHENEEESENSQRRRPSTSDRSTLLSRSFSNLTVPLPEKENEEVSVKQPSYKAPSEMIREQHEIDGATRNNDSSESPVPPKHAKIENGSISNAKVNGVVHDDGDDHISNSDLSVYDSNNLADEGANSLKRQGHDFNELPENDLPPQSNEEAGLDDHPHDSNNDYSSQRRNSDNEQYIPTMILSQSTGAVRRFEQPPSIQNSLSNNYHGSMAEEGALNGGKNNHINEKDHKPHLSEMNTILEPPAYTQSHPNNQNSNGSEHNFSSSISSLTNSLLKTAPESFQGTSRMSHLMRKRTSQNSLMRSDPRQALGSDVPSSSLHREGAASLSSIQNFAQFLKSDAMDGESRTQRKLWLQRENSIMDLTAHNDGSDPIFMASNIEVKREFERISHEYTNVRRFSNPVEEAISRVDSEQKVIGIKSSNKSDSDITSSLFPGNSSRGNEVDQFLPKSQDTKLHRVLSSIWKEETALFNKDTNPLSRLKPNGTGHHFLQPNRSSLRSGMGSGTALQHQRMINSLQPTTRAVNRRMENAIHHQQRL